MLVFFSHNCRSARTENRCLHLSFLSNWPLGLFDLSFANFPLFSPCSSIFCVIA